MRTRSGDKKGPREGGGGRGAGRVTEEWREDGEGKERGNGWRPELRRRRSSGFRQRNKSNGQLLLGGSAVAADSGQWREEHSTERF